MSGFDEGIAKLRVEHPELVDKLDELVRFREQHGVNYIVLIETILGLGFTRAEVSLMVEYKLMTVDHIVWQENPW